MAPEPRADAAGGRLEAAGGALGAARGGNEAGRGGLAAARAALIELVGHLRDPKSTPEVLATAFERCRASFEPGLPAIVHVSATSGRARSGNELALRELADLNALACELAARRHGETTQTLSETRASLSRLREQRPGDTSGRSCDVSH